MSPAMLMKPFWVKPGDSSTFGVPHVSEQGSQVVPAGQLLLAMQLFDDGQRVVPDGQAHVPHWFAYWPPVGDEQLAPVVDDAAVQPPHGHSDVLQTQPHALQSI